MTGPASPGFALSCSASPYRPPAAGMPRAGLRDRALRRRDWAVWGLGLACGLGGGALDGTGWLPFPAALLLAVPLGVAALRQVVPPRRRALVWEETSWQR